MWFWMNLYKAKSHDLAYNAQMYAKFSEKFGFLSGFRARKKTNSAFLQYPDQFLIMIPT